uniref:Uncharacterized protein n=1 Tax=Cucumis melo TaxID=3656 RepID=A0A9I9CYF8_CUCME
MHRHRLEIHRGRFTRRIKRRRKEFRDKHVRRTIHDVQPARCREYTSPNVSVANVDTLLGKHNPQCPPQVLRKGISRCNVENTYPNAFEPTLGK